MRTEPQFRTFDPDKFQNGDVAVFDAAQGQIVGVAPSDLGALGGGEGTGDKSYTHFQSVPATTWTINHNLGKYPAVTDTTTR